MESLANTGPAAAEQNLSPLDRFELLQQRFEHIVESRSSSVEGISIPVHSTEGELTSWLHLSIYLEQVRGLHTEVADVYLGARWGTSKGAADLAVTGVSRATLENASDLHRQEEAMSLLEMSVTTAEDIVFDLK